MNISETVKSNLRDYLNSEYFRKVCKKRFNKKLKIVKKLPEFFNTNYYNISSIQFTLGRFSLHKLDYSDTVSVYPGSIVPQFKIFFNNIPRKAFSSYILTISASGDDCQVSVGMSFSYKELKMLRYYLFCASSEIKKNYDYTENEINNYYS
jgi:hypothetical protein